MQHFRNTPGSDEVCGVVFQIQAQTVDILDRIEGLGFGYIKKAVRVHQLVDNQTLEAFTYIGTRLDPKLKPFSWYKSHVLEGAVEHGLPEPYLKKLRSIETVKDPDGQRHKRELRLYTDP